MEDNFYKDEFEQYLSKQADKYKMFPADKVWNNIQTHLHAPNRWSQLRTTGFVLIVSVLTGLLLLQSEGQIPKLASIQFSLNSPWQLQLIDHQLQTTSDFVVRENRQAATLVAMRAQRKAIHDNWKGKQNSFAENAPIDHVTSFVHSNSSTQNDLTSVNTDAETKEDALMVVDAYNLHEMQIEDVNNFVGDDDANNLVEINTIDQQDKKLKTNLLLNPLEASVENDAVQSFTKQNNIRINKASKFGVQIYASPSISYRQLIDNSPKDQKNAAPTDNSNILSINKLVNQTPSIGFEVGVAGLLQYSKRIKLKLGAQFNYRSYKIDAFSIKENNTSLTLATVSNTRDEKNIFALNRTGDNMFPVQLQNQFFEISAPVGVEYLIAGNKKLQFAIGASFQPTLLLNRDAYVVAANLKNYEEQPNVMRNFNINTSLETFVSYNVGGLTLQAGPQVRYQLLSTYKSDFHLNEKLIDFGFKIGVTKRLK